MENRCKICGGTLSRKGNVITCDYCGNCWISDDTDDLHAVEWANAWQALRDNDFERAAELFEAIASKEPENHEAYWGRALALNGIVYVTELSENKRTPTCNNITAHSFLNDPIVKKAIELAPREHAEIYRAQAERIERIRSEWYEKASHEPAYDIFLSYKDSDAENGIVRTQDSIDAQDLYNALTAEGYKVFFSRVSLRGKVSEQYEPYIYNALKTAKLMIVFGENAAYFRSPWIKNEWGRFRNRIESGEKHKNSLVVVYKNMDPNELPVVLKSRQCLNASEMTFLSDLLRHIRKVVEQSRDIVHLEHIEIAGGVKPRRAAQIERGSIQLHDTGRAAAAETSIDERQMLSLIETYLKAKKWSDTESMLDELLFNNPTYAEAIWLSLLARKKASNLDELFAASGEFGDEDYALIEKALNCASRDFASDLLEKLYAAAERCSDEAYEKLLRVILPFSFPGRVASINSAFESVIRNGQYRSFLALLQTLDENAVDRYIQLNSAFARRANEQQDYNVELECWKRVLSVDSGDLAAHRGCLKALLRTGVDFAQFQTECESLLSCAPDIAGEVRGILTFFSQNMFDPAQCEMVLQTLKYYPGEHKEIEAELLAVAAAMQEQGGFEQAELVYRLVIAQNSRQAQAYWGLCLIRVGAKREEDIPLCDIEINNVPEFNKYLSLVSEERRLECIAVSDRQARKISIRRYTSLGKMIAAGGSHTVGLHTDGTVFAVGNNFKGQCNVSGWRDIVAVAAGSRHTVGLRANGTVVAVGSNSDGQCNVSGWTDIVAIASGDDHTVGLRADGSVVAVGKDKWGQCDVSGWKNIVAIAAGDCHTIGLPVIAVGQNNFHQCNISGRPFSFYGAVAVAAGSYHTVGLKADGTVVAVGYSFNGECDVSGWTDIVAIAAGWQHTVGLRVDGTVVAVGRNNDGQCNVSGWTDIVAVAAGYQHTVGLRADGTVVAVGNDNGGQCNVSGWKLFENYETIEAEKKAAAEKAAVQRIVRIEELNKEKSQLRAELPTIKGLFAGSKKAKIEARLAEIEAELKKLG